MVARLVRWIAGISAWGLIVTIPLSATPPPAPELPLAASAPATPPGRGPGDRAELRAFLDTLFAAALRDHSIPGLAAVVVQDGEVVYTGALGWADAEQQVPMDPASTVFPFGSISKIFTAIAVLQQVEKGALDLDTDIQRYVAPLEISREFDRPVTLRHVLTHTDGFDVRWLFGGATADPEYVRPLRDVLAPLPPRIEPPGELYLYSDVGYALAGFALEQTTGQPFAQLMEERVLRPLAMDRSTFQAWPGNAGWVRATGYEDTYMGDGSNRSVPIAYPIATPAAGLSGPVLDLVPFMLALLPANEAGPSVLLSPESRRLLESRQFSHHDGIPGTGFGFYEYQRNGEQGLLHGGLMLGFTTVVFLLPEHRLGLSVAVNKFGLVSLLEEDLLRAFLDHYYPALSSPAASTFVAAMPPDEHARRYAGLYRCDQYSRRSAEKVALASGWGSEILVTSSPDRRLHFAPGGWWRQIGPDLFENETTRERVAFRIDEDGRAARIVGSPQFMSYHRVRWYERLRVQAGLSAGFLGILLTSVSTAGFAWVMAPRRHWCCAPRRLLAVRLLSIVTLVLVAATLTGVYLTMREIDFTTAFLGQIPNLRLALQFPAWFALTGLAVLVLTLTTPATAWPTRAERIGHLVVGVAVSAFLPVLAYWNLLSIPVSV